MAKAWQPPDRSAMLARQKQRERGWARARQEQADREWARARQEQADREWAARVLEEAEREEREQREEMRRFCEANRGVSFCFSEPAPLFYILNAATAGLIAASAVSARDALLRTVFPRDSGSKEPPRPIAVRATARWSINRVFGGVLPPDLEPATETYGPSSWHLVFEHEGVRYTAWSDKASNPKADVVVQRGLEELPRRGPVPPSTDYANK